MGERFPQATVKRERDYAFVFSLCCLLSVQALRLRTAVLDGIYCRLFFLRSSFVGERFPRAAVKRGRDYTRVCALFVAHLSSVGARLCVRGGFPHTKVRCC